MHIAQEWALPFTWLLTDGLGLISLYCLYRTEEWIASDINIKQCCFISAIICNSLPKHQNMCCFSTQQFNWGVLSVHDSACGFLCAVIGRWPQHEVQQSHVTYMTSARPQKRPFNLYKPSIQPWSYIRHKKSHQEGWSCGILYHRDHLEQHNVNSSWTFMRPHLKTLRWISSISIFNGLLFYSRGVIYERCMLSLFRNTARNMPHISFTVSWQEMLISHFFDRGVDGTVKCHVCTGVYF